MKRWKGKTGMINYKRIEVSGVSSIFPMEYRATYIALAKEVERTISVVANYWDLSLPRLWSSCIDWFGGICWQNSPKTHTPFGQVDQAFVVIPCTASLYTGWWLTWRGRLSVGVKPPKLLVRLKSGLGRGMLVFMLTTISLCTPLSPKVSHCQVLTIDTGRSVSGRWNDFSFSLKPVHII